MVITKYLDSFGHNLNHWRMPLLRDVLPTLALAVLLAAHAAHAAYIEPHECGGAGQKPCEISAAKNHGRVLLSNPGDGAFQDPRNGGEWWRCPQGYARNLNPVTSPNACTSVNIKFDGVNFLDPRGGGEWWGCPAGFSRTVFPVDGDKACEKGLDRPSGAFLDIGRGEYWTCEGWDRTWDPVTSGTACSQGWFNTRPAKYVGKALEWSSATSVGKLIQSTNATYIGKSKRPKPSGAFEDPRLDLDLLGRKAEYWSCPSGFWRNLNPVTHSTAACTVDVGKNCDAGNIATGMPWGGYTCQVKGQCGAKGQRPCQIVERLPSCDSGLAEDFIDHVCVDEQLAMCLTMTRLAWIARESQNGVNDAIRKLERPVNLMLEKLWDALPAEVRDSLEKGSKEVQAKILDPLESTVTGEMTKVADALDPGGKLASLNALRTSVTENRSQIVDFFADSSSCTMSEAERTRRMQNLVSSPSDLSTMSFAALTPDSWIDQAVDAIIAPAHAYTNMRTYGVAGVSVTIVIGNLWGGGVTFDWFGVWGDGESGMGISVGGVGAFNNPALSVDAFGGMKSGKSVREMGGANIIIGGEVPTSTKTNAVGKIGMAFSFRGPAEWEDQGAVEAVTFSGGIDADVDNTKREGKRTLNFGKTKSAGPVEVFVGGNYEWMLMASSRRGNGDKNARGMSSNAPTFDNMSPPAVAAPVLEPPLMRDGIVLYGNDLTSFVPTQPHPGECHSACAINPHCEAWTFIVPGKHPSAPRCFLKNSEALAIRAPVRDECCVSGYKTHMQAATDRYGSDYRYFEPSVEDPSICEAACRHEEQCQAWTTKNVARPRLPPAAI